MKISKKYEAVVASNKENFKKILLGGHIVEIVDASEYESSNGTELMKFTFDVIEDGEFNHYFESDAHFDKEGNIVWPNGGTKYILPENSELLKQLDNSINSSNEDQVVVTGGEDLDFQQFCGKQLCCQFGLEEYYNNSGEVKAGLCIKGFYPIADLDSIEVPLVKLIDGNEIPYEEYKKNKAKRKERKWKN